jgi:transcriptional regulator with XRE-family HTH domain
MRRVVYVGNRLRRLREHEALTQAELSKRTGISINSISAIEQDKQSARLSTVRKLADALGVHPSELTGK